MATTKKKSPISLESLGISSLNELEQELLIKSGCLWVPQNGPQLEAYNSKADELYYGGAAGGGKTDLVLGLAATKHQRSIVFRRTYPELRFIKERAEEIWGHLRREGAGYNDTYNLWRFPNGKTVEFGAVVGPSRDVLHGSRGRLVEDLRRVRAHG